MVRKTNCPRDSPTLGDFFCCCLLIIPRITLRERALRGCANVFAFPQDRYKSSLTRGPSDTRRLRKSSESPRRSRTSPRRSH